MSMNIKSAEAHELARELAAVEHTTVTEAVTIALREAIDHRRAEQAALERRERASSILERMRQSLKDDEGPSLWEINEDLYDEMGLPK